jgi:TolB-like protein/Tfp pilus assembly protein PilF
VTTTAINSGDVKTQLTRVLQAPAFRNSITLSRFLQFIVEETLAGHETELKEYTIALKVLSKKQDFNPQVDPIIRIHAGRLRRALNEYYLVEGKNDRLVISIPKGAYVPVFTENKPEVQAPLSTKKTELPARKKITVAVLPFSNSGADANTEAFADGLAEHISTELTRYSELSVISYYSCRNIISRITDIKEAGLVLDAQYILTGTVQTAQKLLRIRVQLILAETREQVWADAYERDNTASQLFEVQDEIVWKVVSAMAGNYGAISRNLARLHQHENVNDPGVYNSIYWYYHFVADLSGEMFHKAENAMNIAVKADPSYALGWAVLGELFVGGFFMGHKSGIVDNQLEQAVVYGKKALRLDPSCQQGYQTLALANLFLGRKEESLKAIEEWMKVKPGEAGIKGAMGFVLICCGEYENGYKMLDESVQLNPYYQWWFNAGFSFYFFHQGEYANAFYWAEKINMPDVAWELILKIAACIEMDLKETSQQYALKLKTEFPVIVSILPTYLHAFLQDQTLVAKLENALKKAGFLL